MITVTISVTNVDEAPSVSGTATIQLVEGVLVLALGNGEPAVYTAIDVDAGEGSALSFSLSGADSDKFKLTPVSLMTTCVL